MSSDEKFRNRIQRLQKWVNRVSHTWQKELSETETMYVNLIREMEEEKLHTEQELKNEEEHLKGQLDQASKDYVRIKYLFEKDSNQSKADIERAGREMEKTKQHLASEVARLNQEKLNNQISFERQKNALHDLYQEKKRHLLVTREKLIRESTQSQGTYTQYKEKYDKNLESIKQENHQKIEFQTDQLKSKRDGWNMAIETMKRELGAIQQQKSDVENKLASIQAEKENEIENLHMQIEVSKEQLELDKVTLVEKAEEDQRSLEKEIQTLQDQINDAEKNLQNMILQKENEKKTSEEEFQHEENLLKESLKNEAERRDYEQKLYAQEKTIKDKELNQLKEDYEKKKAHWDNQLKTLMMQKSLQDADHDAERMRTEREARVLVRSLQSKQEELKQKLIDLQNRHEAYQTNAAKELELMKQRWHWRKDRLWQMWQNRLNVLKKEREMLGEQLTQLMDSFQKQKQNITEDTQQQDTRVEDLKQAIVQGQDQWTTERRQREIQLELEKTRIIAQIKECETLVTEWMDKQKLTHEEVMRRKGAFVDDIDFLDRYYRSQQDETEVFLCTFQKALAFLKEELERYGMKQDAA